MKTALVFEHRGRRSAGGRGPRNWMHYACVRDTWKAGKFHNPVSVPSSDLEGAVCVLCGAPVLDQAQAQAE